MSKIVNIGIIGMGNIGQLYAEQLGSREGCRLVSICSQTESKIQKLAEQYGVKGYTNYTEMLDAGDVDAVIVATPHYQHTEAAIAALRRNIHVLVEKPVAARISDAERMVAVYEEQKKQCPELLFAAVYQYRTAKRWQIVKQMLDNGELGKLMRYSWISTDWFRPQAYYNVGSWRGTWQGEGGGVLLNQCAHNLDILWWLFGLPKSIMATASFGKYHHIEVEDEVQALLEYPNRLVGSFIASTAECPGTNRLEIVGELGRLVLENKQIVIHRNDGSSLDYIYSSDQAFGTVAHQIERIDTGECSGPGHAELALDFIRAIAERKQPLVPASDGMHSLMMINGIVMSAVRERKVHLPLDSGEYDETLQSLISQSTYTKPDAASIQVSVNMKDSFR